MRRLGALCADRYTIGIHYGSDVKKLFQIIPAKTGSLYVSFPYSPFDVGRVGILTLPANSEDGVIFGENDPITTEKVKYSHHPSGAVHFSQTGRVRTDIRKSGVPFGRISGHIFTITLQGIDRYKSVDPSARKKGGSIVAAFAEPEQSAGAYKFIAHVYSERELARRSIGSMSGVWMRSVVPSGKILWGILLATQVQSQEGRKFLSVMLEPIDKVCAQYEEMLMFLGGFDPPEVSLDPSKDTRALILLYPERDYTDELIRRVGSIDLQKPDRSQAYHKRKTDT